MEEHDDVLEFHGTQGGAPRDEEGSQHVDEEVLHAGPLRHVGVPQSHCQAERELPNQETIHPPAMRRLLVSLPRRYKVKGLGYHGQ